MDISDKSMKILWMTYLLFIRYLMDYITCKAKCLVFYHFAWLMILILTILCLFCLLSNSPCPDFGGILCGYYCLLLWTPWPVSCGLHQWAVLASGMWRKAPQAGPTAGGPFTGDIWVHNATRTLALLPFLMVSLIGKFTYAKTALLPWQLSSFNSNGQWFFNWDWKQCHQPSILSS